MLVFEAAQPLAQLFVSTVTFAEIRFGIEVIGDAVRRAELIDWFDHRLRPLFEQRVLAVSEDVMFKWRLLEEDGRKASHTFSQPDLLIAATGLQHGLTFVTRGTADFTRTQVALFDPWGDTLPSPSPG